MFLLDHILIMLNWYPYTVKGASDNAELKIDSTIFLRKHIIQLAGIPASAVKTLSPQDFNAAVLMVSSFSGRQLEEVRKVAADVAYFFKWSAGDVMNMPVAELYRWQSRGIG